MTPFLLVGDVAFSQASKSPWQGQEVQEILHRGPTVANVECVRTKEPHQGGTRVLEPSPQAASWCSDATVDIASLAAAAS